MKTLILHNRRTDLLSIVCALEIQIEQSRQDHKEVTKLEQARILIEEELGIRASLRP